MECDILVIGAGPAGLAFAQSLEGAGLSVTLIDAQPRAALETPAFDGREIALTHRSVATLKALGAWERLEPLASPLREARVLNGASSFALSFSPGADGPDRLGWLVPNHEIRAALFDRAIGGGDAELLTGRRVARLERGRGRYDVELDDGTRRRARLLVGADSRFSWTRDALGIPAAIHRLGKTMLVCRVAHERPHDGVALEWFDHHQTVAMLPLDGNRSGAVLTLPGAEIDRLMAIDDAALGEELTRRTQARLGTLEVVGSRHAYPLAVTWSRHFAAPRAALIGDAAVGMHPVTAHGFNLGLSGQALLADAVRAAAARGRDIGGAPVLRAYESAHRRAAWPLWAGTNAIVRVFTDDAAPMRLVRHAGLRIAAALPPVRSSVRRMLMAG